MWYFYNSENYGMILEEAENLQNAET